MGMNNSTGDATELRAALLLGVSPQSSWWRVFAVSVGVLPLVACSGSASTADSEVIATVNGSSVTAAQLENSKPFAFLNDPRAAQGNDAHPLDTLINEELLMQEAHKAKLDSDRTVQQEIERATRKILGEAYVQREIVPKVTVSTEEVRAFYDRYPALFKHRRIFKFTEFVVANTTLTTQLRAEIAQVRSADELRNRLNRSTVKYTQSKQVMSAEQLPMDRMSDLAKATVGDVLLIAQDSTSTRLLAITSIEEDPQAFAQAQPRIEQYLVNTRAQQLLLDHLKLVRATANISVPRSATVASINGGQQAPVTESGSGNVAFQLGAVTHAGASHVAP